jgi:hypothetical protein
VNAPDKPAAIEVPRVRNGSELHASDGTIYTVSNLRRGLALTLTRLTPKVRGKSARRAEKKARQFARHQRDRS